VNRILVIDDDERICSTIRRWLETGDDYEVMTETSPKAGLRAANRNMPDLILLDVAMPKLNGIEVLRRLHMRMSTRFIPVIMITATDDDESREAARYEYAEQYISKPIDKQYLESRIEQTLKHYRKINPYNGLVAV